MKKDKFISLNNYGKLAVLTGLILLMPLGCLIFYPEDIEYAHCFLIPGFSAILIGILICKFGKPFEASRFYSVTLRNSTLIVLFSWAFSCVMGALPFVLSGQLNFLQALFESVSGYTGAGLTVIDIAGSCKSILFYRSLTQFVGGLGFVLLFLVIVNDKQSMDLFNAEGHPDKLKPNLRVTARTILWTYLVLVGIGTLGCWILGMDFFDSLNHTMTSIATGGFSTKVDGLEGYSWQIQLWIVVVMLLGCINTAVLLLAVKGKFKEVVKNSELRFLNGMMIFFTIIVMISLKNTKTDIGSNFVFSLFNVVSSFSTTGAAMGSFVNLSHIAIFSFTLLMIFGGSMGSTAGGIKLSRVYIFLRMMIKSVRDKLHPSRNLKLMHMYKSTGESVIDEKQQKDAINYVGIYTCVYIIGVIALMFASGCQLHESMFEFASCLSTVGLTIGVTTPASNAATLIVEMIGMFLGRLEIIPVFFGFSYVADAVKDKINK